MLALRLALALFLASTSVAMRAKADTSFVPTYAEGRALLARATSERLERLLAALPQVVTARVHVTVIDDSRLPLDRPRPSPRVSAWLLLDGTGPSDADLMTLLSSAAPDLEPSDIRIVRQFEATRSAGPLQAKLAEVGPFRVAPRSASGLRLLLGALLTVIVLLSSAVLWRGHRLKP